MQPRFCLSRYTIISDPFGERFSLYSMKTGRHAIFNLDKNPEFRRLFEKRVVSEDDLGAFNIEALRKEGFLIREGFDELSELKRRRGVTLNSDYGLRLAILPTLTCNFNCHYCFQKRPQGRVSMSAQTKENLLMISEKILTSESNGPLSVTWFGGEPLLELDTIRELTKKLRQMAGKHGITSHFSMITNGYSLDLLTPRILKELDLFYIQVTLDGPEDIHNRRRPLMKGGETYATILKNISTISRHTSAITVRINIDRTNYTEVPLLLSEIKEKGILDRCTFQPACVDASTGTCAANSCHTLKTKKWADVERFIYEEAKKLGITHRIKKRYPEAWSLSCSAQIKNALVIDPEGNVFKCLNDASITERAITNINHNLPLNVERAEQLKKFSPFSQRKCEVCMFLPLCNGGCPSSGIEQNTTENQCTYLKYSLKERLDNYLQEYVENQNDIDT